MVLVTILVMIITTVTITTRPMSATTTSKQLTNDATGGNPGGHATMLTMTM